MRNSSWRWGKTHSSPRIWLVFQAIKDWWINGGERQGRCYLAWPQLIKSTCWRMEKGRTSGWQPVKTRSSHLASVRLTEQELGSEGSDPVVPTRRRDNVQFPAVSASDNPIIPSLFFQSLFEPVTHYKQNVFVLFLTTKLWNNKGLGKELPTCVFLPELQQSRSDQSSALLLDGVFS